MYKHHAQTGVQVQRQTCNPSDITVCYTPMRLEGHSVIGRVENRKSSKITKLQVDPIDAHKNKTICMI